MTIHPRLKFDDFLSGFVWWIQLTAQARSGLAKIKHPRDGRKGSAKSNRTAGHYTKQLSCGPWSYSGGVVSEKELCVNVCECVCSMVTLNKNVGTIESG